MNHSLLLGGVLAVALFWAVGAYNRLVRLRAAVLAGADSLATQMLSLCALTQGLVQPQAGPGEGVRQADDPLQEATQALQAAAASFRLKPWEQSHADAVLAAYRSVLDAWQAVCTAPPDLAGEPVPAELQQSWARQHAEVERERHQLHQHITGYNLAIEQFPAKLLARLFGFQPAPPVQTA